MSKPSQESKVDHIIETLLDDEWMVMTHNGSEWHLITRSHYRMCSAYRFELVKPSDVYPFDAICGHVVNLHGSQLFPSTNEKPNMPTWRPAINLSVMDIKELCPKCFKYVDMHPERFSFTICVMEDKVHKYQIRKTDV